MEAHTWATGALGRPQKELLRLARLEKQNMTTPIELSELIQGKQVAFRVKFALYANQKAQLISTTFFGMRHEHDQIVHQVALSNPRSSIALGTMKLTWR